MNWARFFSRKHVDWRDILLANQEHTIKALTVSYVKNNLEIERLNRIIIRLLTEGVRNDQRGSSH